MRIAAVLRPPCRANRDRAKAVVLDGPSGDVGCNGLRHDRTVFQPGAGASSSQASAARRARSGAFGLPHPVDGLGSGISVCYIGVSDDRTRAVVRRVLLDFLLFAGRWQKTSRLAQAVCVYRSPVHLTFYQSVALHYDAC